MGFQNPGRPALYRILHSVDLLSTACCLPSSEEHPGSKALDAPFSLEEVEAGFLAPKKNDAVCLSQMQLALYQVLEAAQWSVSIYGNEVGSLTSAIREGIATATSRFVNAVEHGRPVC